MIVFFFFSVSLKLTEKKAVGIALEDNYDVGVFRERVEWVFKEKEGLWKRALPSLLINGGYNYSFAYPDTSLLKVGAYVNLNLTQILEVFLTPVKEYERFKIIESKEQQKIVERKVRFVYILLNYAHTKKLFLDSIANVYHRQYNEFIKRYNEGEISKEELNYMKLLYLETVGDSLKNAIELITYENAMLVFLGLGDSVHIVPADSFYPLLKEFELDSTKALAVKNNLTLKKINVAIQLTRKNIEIPRINTYIGIGYGNKTHEWNGSEALEGGIGFNFNLYKQKKVDSVQMIKRILRIKRKMLKDVICESFNAFIGIYNTEKVSLSVLEQSIASFKEIIDRLEIQYEEGYISLKQLNDVQKEYRKLVLKRLDLIKNINIMYINIDAGIYYLDPEILEKL